MADLNRQLQDYLAESKTGGAGRKPSAPVTSPSSSSDGSSGGGWMGSLPSPRVTWPWSPSQSSTSAGAVESACLPSMSRGQRLALSAACALLAACCFTLAVLHAPLLVLRARKFALLWSLGSVLALAAAALLLGAGATTRMAREPGALLYLAALGGTLYAAVGLRSTAFTVLGAATQALGLLIFLLALVPGGATGLRYLGGLCGSLLRRGVSKSLPV
ncbi:vesicle transport protein SFT2C [Ambystoma mexicanum]|uniref:vesicle transport protein SFT2C n=1 Tax=Ambystoma mexicanum TaxID=8296 RepID=UPI0037E994F0